MQYTPYMYVLHILHVLHALHVLYALHVLHVYMYQICATARYPSAPITDDPG